MNDSHSRIPGIAHQWSRRDEGVVHSLTITNPQRLNVVTAALMDELRSAIEQFGSERDARVLLLRGAGAHAWIGGIDSDELAALSVEDAPGFIGKLNHLCAAIRDVPVPVIAVIRGYCLGPGLEIAASCDFRIAAADASFGMPEVYAGMPAVTGAAILPHIIGVGRTRELVLTGRIIDTRTAYRWGLVEGMCPPGPALDALVEARVADILMGSARAIALQKRLCKLWEERPLRESWDVGAKAFAKAIAGREPSVYFAQRQGRKDADA